MIYQLPSGRTVELSIEQYLSLDESDIQELNGISSSYSNEFNNPFQNLFSGSIIDIDIDDPNLPDEIYELLISDEEITLELPDMNDNDKLEDNYFHSDDI
jgi:hypothetical protein